MENSEAKIRAFIQHKIRERATVQSQPSPNLNNDLNLVDTRLFDSLSFVQLIVAIEKEFDVEIDIGDFGPEEFTVLGNLVRAAAASTAAANGLQ
jgi:acyl carrier protein